jgi:hypothetical protein
MVPHVEDTRPKRRPAVLWTPWGPIPKGGKVRPTVKLHWLPNAVALRPGEALPKPAAPKRG